MTTERIPAMEDSHALTYGRPANQPRPARVVFSRGDLLFYVLLSIAAFYGIGLLHGMGLQQSKNDASLDDQLLATWTTIRKDTHPSGPDHTRGTAEARADAFNLDAHVINSYGLWEEVELWQVDPAYTRRLTY